MEKSRDAFRTISEVSEALGTQPHVLRFWESKFSQVKPVKRAGGRRYYRPNDVDLLAGIKKLLHDDGITIKGVQKILRERGVKYVTGLMSAGAEADAAPDVEDAVVVSMDRKPSPTAESDSERPEDGIEINSLTNVLKVVNEISADELEPILHRLKALKSRLASKSPSF